MYLVKFSFRLGRKKKRDKLFGGVRMEMIKSKDLAITFKDVAGIDQVIWCRWNSFVDQIVPGCRTNAFWHYAAASSDLCRIAGQVRDS